MDHQFTAKLNDWLSNPEDLAQGALLLLQLTGNTFQYQKLLSDLPHYRDYIIERLKQFAVIRNQGLDHQAVVAEVEKAGKAVDDAASEDSRQFTGKRPDHDSLPDKIQQLYDSNLELYSKMRDLHAKVRLIAASNASCKDADLLPFAREIVKLDKQRLKNWEEYDSFKG
ncbi:MAG: hypothetical protein HDT02_03595 [Bacteroidales bacterium]|nr:hypothetical protein [Bacteroidales bacterium]